MKAKFEASLKKVPLEVASAIELSRSQKDRLLQNLHEVYPDVEYVPEFIVDPSLISGLKITTDRKIYDASYKKLLSNLSAEMLSIKDKGRKAISEKTENAADEDAEGGEAGIQDFSDFIKKAEEAAGRKRDIPHVERIGRVERIADGVAEVSGLLHCMVDELLLFSGGERGLAMNLNEDSVGVVIMGSYENIKEGDVVYRSKRVLSVPVGDSLIGRIVSPLGEAMDAKGEIKSQDYAPIESEAPEVMMRGYINKPLETGLIAIDSLVPIGRGQRELIIGDRKTGKTSLAVDTILNQAGKNVYCVYVAIGQKESSINEVADRFIRSGAMAYTCIVATTSADPVAMQYIAPYSATSVAEYWMKHGHDVLIVYDDLSKHAVAYREISLLLRRPPGREAYPGDVFYLHSRLLERSAKLSDDLGGGSITALPIIETQFGDVSAYIPTNVISITDGQIFLDTGLFNNGQRPAINVGISVSRVGSAAQIKALKQVSGMLRLKLAQHRELKSFSRFASALDENTLKILRQGEIMTMLLKQGRNDPMTEAEQVLLIYAAEKGLFDCENDEEFAKLIKKFRGQLRSPDNANMMFRLLNGEKLEGRLMEMAELLIKRFFRYEKTSYGEINYGE